MTDEDVQLPLFERVFAKWCFTIYKSRILRTWYKIVMSTEWEAAILFILYLFFRWYGSLESLSVILLVTGVLVSIKATQSWNGQFFYRAHLWMQLAYTKQYSFTALERTGFVIEFFSFMHVFSIPLIPISIIHSSIFLLCAMAVGKSDSLSDQRKFWTKIGWTAYAILRKFNPVLLFFYSNSTQKNFPESTFGKTIPENEVSTLAEKLIHFFYVFTLILVISCGLYYAILLIPAFLFFSICGRHIAVTAIVVLEAYTEWYDIKLTIITSQKLLSTEFYALICLVIPIYGIVFYKVQKSWVTAALEELKSDPNMSADWKRLANLFFKIPITEKQAGVKLFDNLHREDFQIPERDTQLKVLLDENLNEHGRVKIMFIDERKIWDKKKLDRYRPF